MKKQPVRCLITAGPTREFFDPVRFLSNPSTGKMGYAIAAAAARAGLEVTLVSGPVSGIKPPERVECVKVTTGEEMFLACEERFVDCDVFIATAAVMDYRPKAFSEQKIKKSGDGLTIELEPVRDILKTLGHRKQPGQLVVGFAAETNDVENYALSKLREKNCDLIVANQVGGENSAFGSDENTLYVLGKDGSRKVLGPGLKQDLAEALVGVITAWALRD